VLRRVTDRARGPWSRCRGGRSFLAAHTLTRSPGPAALGRWCGPPPGRVVCLVLRRFCVGRVSCVSGASVVRVYSAAVRSAHAVLRSPYFSPFAPDTHDTRLVRWCGPQSGRSITRKDGERERHKKINSAAVRSAHAVLRCFFNVVLSPLIVLQKGLPTHTRRARAGDRAFPARKAPGSRGRPARGPESGRGLKPRKVHSGAGGGFPPAPPYKRDQGPLFAAPGPIVERIGILIFGSWKLWPVLPGEALEFPQ